MTQSFLGIVEGCSHAENRFASLNGHDTSGGETLAVSDSVDVIQDGNGGIARAEKVGVE